MKNVYMEYILELERKLSLAQDELNAMRHTIIATIGGVDSEGFPTCELNYLQRLRILVQKERELDRRNAK